jgi:hypothetical protein
MSTVKKYIVFLAEYLKESLKQASTTSTFPAGKTVPIAGEESFIMLNFSTKFSTIEICNSWAQS